MGLRNLIVRLGKGIASVPSTLENILNKPFGTDDIDLDDGTVKEFEKEREEGNPVEYASEKYTQRKDQVKQAKGALKRRLGETVIFYFPIAVGLKKAEWDLIQFETYGVISLIVYSGIAWQSYVIYGSIRRYLGSRKKQKLAKERAQRVREYVFLNHMDKKIAAAEEDEEKSELEKLKEEFRNYREEHTKVRELIERMSQNELKVIETIDFTLREDSEPIKAHNNYKGKYSINIELFPYLLNKIEDEDVELYHVDISKIFDELITVREDETTELRYATPSINATEVRFQYRIPDPPKEKDSNSSLKEVELEPFNTKFNSLLSINLHPNPKPGTQKLPEHC